MRARPYELDTAMDDVSNGSADSGRLAVAVQRDELVTQLQALLEGSDLGVQHNDDRDFAKAAVFGSPIFIQGDRSEHG